MPPLLYSHEDVHVLDQRAVLDNDIIRFIHLAAFPDFFVIEPDKGLDRRPAAFDTERRECLGKDAAFKCGDCNQFGSSDRPLATPAVDT